MATATPNLAATTIFTIVSLLLISVAQIAAFHTYTDEDDHGVHVLDNPVSSLGMRSSRFLAASVINKGTHCNPAKSICNGVSANGGTSLLYCCKAHCRNVLSDRNECGRCGNKCKYGQLCCHGVCTSVAYNDSHCGKCSNECPSGVKCEYGSCGYA